MDVNASKAIDLSSYSYASKSSAGVQTETFARKQESSAKVEAAKQEAEFNNIKQLNHAETEHLTDEMNKMMQLVNADIRFAMHEATSRLMVQVVDTKEQKVLKEFPPHELLDTMAKIKNYIGFLLDKRA